MARLGSSEPTPAVSVRPPRSCCYDVRIRQPDGKASDAIAVGLEHRVGDTVTILLPSSKGRFGGIKSGELTATPGEHRVFVGN